jgi:predicted transcriptional regulator
MKNNETVVQKNNRIVPTSAELNLLNILWRIGPATVRQVHDYVCKSHNTGYTTVLKLFQIMHEKGLVSRDESNRAHIYSAAYSEVQTQSSMVKDMVSKAFGGSKFDLVVRALGETASSDEIAEIRDLLNTIEKNKK